ncbi:MAG: DinB family protein, partial [Chloroflexota bacterium]
MDKAELLAKTRASWDVLNAYIATLNEEQLTQLTDAAGWSVKDHLIHIAVWEDGIWALLNKQSRAAQMGLEGDIWRKGGIDRANAIIHQQHEADSLADVEQKRHAIHDRLIQQIAAMSDKDLLHPYAYYQAQAASETHAVIDAVIGDTFEHYEQHIPWIKAIV